MTRIGTGLLACILAGCSAVVRPTATVTWVRKERPAQGENGSWQATTGLLASIAQTYATVAEPWTVVVPVSGVLGTSAIRATERSGGEVVRLALPVPTTGAAELEL